MGEDSAAVQRYIEIITRALASPDPGPCTEPPDTATRLLRCYIHSLQSDGAPRTMLDAARLHRMFHLAQQEALMPGVAKSMQENMWSFMRHHWGGVIEALWRYCEAVCVTKCDDRALHRVRESLTLLMYQATIMHVVCSFLRVCSVDFNTGATQIRDFWIRRLSATDRGIVESPGQFLGIIDEQEALLHRYHNSVLQFVHVV